MRPPSAPHAALPAARPPGAQELFKHYTGSRGYLVTETLQSMLQDMLPNLTKGDLYYFQVRAPHARTHARTQEGCCLPKLHCARAVHTGVALTCCIHFCVQ